MRRSRALSFAVTVVLVLACAVAAQITLTASGLGVVERSATGAVALGLALLVGRRLDRRRRRTA